MMIRQKEERPSKRVRSDVDIDPLMTAVLPAPSSFSDPKIWKGHQLESPLLLNHRPSTANGVPITLSHPIFARFQELCNSCEVNQEECDFVLNLTSVMSDPFKDEDKRRDKFVEIVEQYFLRSCDRTFFGKTHTDGCITMRKGLLRIPLAILEVKPELGIGSGCPYVQATAYYGRYIVDGLSEAHKKDHEQLRYSSCCPAFLIYLTGPYVGIAGAVYSERASFDPLSPVIPLLFLNHYPESMLLVARVFRALKICLSELETYYENLKFISKNDNIPRQAAFPYIQEIDFNGE